MRKTLAGHGSRVRTLAGRMGAGRSRRFLASASRIGLIAGLMVAFGFAAVALAEESNGGRYYRRECARCHGPHGRGDGPDAVIFPSPPRNLRTDFLNNYPNAELIRRVRRGAPLRLELDPKAMQARQHEVAVLTRHLERLPTIEWGRIELGRDVYAERCASCHGLYGHPPKAAPAGSAGAPSLRDLSDSTFQGETTDDRLRALVLDQHARVQSPSPKMPAADADAVVAYVRLLSPGYELYSRFCSNCHGDNGRGLTAIAGAPLPPTVVFNEAYFAQHDSAYVSDRIWHMVAEKKPHMPHLKHEVSETAARAIILFLKEIQN